MAKNTGQLINYQVQVIFVEAIVVVQNIGVMKDIAEAVAGAHVSLTVMGTHAVVIRGVQMATLGGMAVLVSNVNTLVVGKANGILADGDFKKKKYL